MQRISKILMNHRVHSIPFGCAKFRYNFNDGRRRTEMMIGEKIKQSSGMADQPNGNAMRR